MKIGIFIFVTLCSWFQETDAVSTCSQDEDCVYRSGSYCDFMCQCMGAKVTNAERSGNGLDNLLPAVSNVGVGYNILQGNPYGTDWRHGGEDPGLLATRQILLLESNISKFSDQLVIKRHGSCQASSTDRLIYSAKSYQDHLGHRVTFAGTSIPDLQASAFTLSSGYVSVKKVTDALFYVLQDNTSTCVDATARYMLNHAPVNSIHLTDEFMTDACALPGTFDADRYINFIDKWGTLKTEDSPVWLTGQCRLYTAGAAYIRTYKIITKGHICRIPESMSQNYLENYPGKNIQHVVTGMKIGFRDTTITVATRTEYIMTVREKSKADVTVGEPLYNRTSSWVVNLDTLMLRPSYPMTVGNTTYKLTTGSKTSPEPIELALTSIDIMLTNDVWTSKQYLKSRCPSNMDATLSSRRGNLIKALQQYASSKGAEMPKDKKLAVPRSVESWPTGTVGLPKPKEGCPLPSTMWMEGWLRQNPETQSPNSAWNVTHLDATMSKTSFLLKFCMKVYAEEEFSMDWPVGDYCIFKFKQCPTGFSEGFVQWDDDDTNNANAHGGVLPDGVYGSDTRMKYCCRSDGHSYIPITLPTEKPFYLFQYKNGCQSVRGMSSTTEYIFWDDEDGKGTTSAAAIGDVHPGMEFCNPPKWSGGCTASRIFYCYYTKKK